MSLRPASSLGINRYGSVSGSGGAPATDPFFANVTYLLHFEGVNNGSVFTDVKGNTWTRPGSAVTSTEQKKAGNTSGKFISNNRIETVSSAGFDFGAGDFTIELFVYWLGAGSGGRFFLDSWSSRFLFRYDAGTTLQFFANAVGSPVLSVAYSLPTNQWVHLAVTRTGNVWRLFVDGVQQATATIAGTIGNVASDLRVGCGTGIDGWDGYIDELRITKGVSRYTSNFTPPATPFPDA